MLLVAVATHETLIHDCNGYLWSGPKLAENVPQMCRKYYESIKLAKLNRNGVLFARNAGNVAENEAFKVALLAGDFQVVDHIQGCGSTPSSV